MHDYTLCLLYSCLRVMSYRVVEFVRVPVRYSGANFRPSYILMFSLPCNSFYIPGNLLVSKLSRSKSNGTRFSVFTTAPDGCFVQNVRTY